MTTFAELNTRQPNGEPLISIENVFDMNEILAVRNENEWRAQKHAEKKSSNPKK